MIKILNSKLRKRTTKQLLFELSDLETGSVYLLTAANQNVLLLEQLRNHPHIQKLGSIELEQLDDALIEAGAIVSHDTIGFSDSTTTFWCLQ